jgi:hypothetical protein
MVPHAFPHCTTRPTCQHFCRYRLRTLWPCPTISQLRPADVAIGLLPGALPEPVSHLLLDFTIIPTPPSTIHPTLAALDNPSLTSVVQLHEHAENKKCLGRHSTNRPADAVTAAIVHQRYCLVPFTIDPGGQLGPLTSSLLWPRKRHPAAILPPSHARSIRGLPPARIPANTAAWREAHGDHFWFTRNYSATLPSHWAQQVLGHNLLVDPTSLSPNPCCSSPRHQT